MSAPKSKFAGSKIIKILKIEQDILKLFAKNPDLFLLFQGSRDGFTAKSFHKNCDNQGPTLILIFVKETQRLFGAFTDIPWKSKGGWVKGNGNSFLFSLRPDGSIEKLNHKKN